MPNVSELCRLEEELAAAKEAFRDGMYRDKAGKERLLSDMRHAAHALGEFVPKYNSTEFVEWLKK